MMGLIGGRPATPRFRFLLKNGSMVDGPVQGSGGFVTSARVLESMHGRAKRGEPLERVYEPEKGCIAVFPGYSSSGNGARHLVRLKDVVRIEPCGFSR